MATPSKNPATQGAREVFGEVGLVTGATVTTAKGAADLSDRSITHELLTGIQTELRLLNKHLATITGEIFTEEDTDDGD